jgi:type IV secretory pathway VirJ component
VSRSALIALAVAVSWQGMGAAPQPEAFVARGFGTVAVYRPAGDPTHVVLFVSGDGGWNLGVVSMADRLRSLGALVVGVDIRAFLKGLESTPGCAFPAGNLENLSRDVQLRYRLPVYHRPILVGYSSGATLVYAAIAAAPPETFAGAISLGFCPDLELRAPLCQMRGLRATKRSKGPGVDLAEYPESRVPWMVLQGEIDQVCSPDQTRRFVAATGSARLFSLPKVGHGFGVPARWEPQFVEAYQTIAKAASPPRPELPAAPGVGDLGLVEVPASAGSPRGDAWALLLTGDGGWADIDKSLAAALAAKGIPVVGWSSLDYYWTPRTPEGAAADLARVIEHYAATWRLPRVFLAGYSFGADVLPFLTNRLPETVRGRVAGVTLLGPSETAAFEFHVSSWIGGGGDPRHRTVPEVGRLAMPVTCVSATDEPESICDAMRSPRVRVAKVGKGHHFSGEYGRLAELVAGR